MGMATPGNFQTVHLSNDDAVRVNVKSDGTWSLCGVRTADGRGLVGRPARRHVRRARLKDEIDEFVRVTR